MNTDLRQFLYKLSALVTLHIMQPHVPTLTKSLRSQRHALHAFKLHVSSPTPCSSYCMQLLFLV